MSDVPFTSSVSVGVVFLLLLLPPFIRPFTHVIKHFLQRIPRFTELNEASQVKTTVLITKAFFKIVSFLALMPCTGHYIREISGSSFKEALSVIHEPAYLSIAAILPFYIFEMIVVPDIPNFLHNASTLLLFGLFASGKLFTSKVDIAFALGGSVIGMQIMSLSFILFALMGVAQLMNSCTKKVKILMCAGAWHAFLVLVLISIVVLFISEVSGAISTGMLVFSIGIMLPIIVADLHLAWVAYGLSWEISSEREGLDVSEMDEEDPPKAEESGRTGSDLQESDTNASSEAVV